MRPSGRYLQPELLLLRPETTERHARAGMATNYYAYALNNPMHWVDRDGSDYDNPVCTERYYDSEGKTPGRPGAPGGATQGDLQCTCYMREETPGASDVCHQKSVDFNPGGESCPPGLKGGLPDCDSFCKDQAEAADQPIAAGWKKLQNCPSRPLLSCGGPKPISKFVKKHTCQ